MMMSIEKVNAITDPEKKVMATALLSLQQNAINAAKEKRDKRVEALLKKRKDDKFKEKILALVAGATFSLGTDGVVTDSIGQTLDMLEMSVVDIPVLLAQNGIPNIQEVEQPKDNTTMDEEKRKSLANRLVKSTGNK